MARAFPVLPVHPIAGDFTHPLVLPASIRNTARLGFFPGSTICNMTVPVGVDLLRAIARALGNGAMLLIGIDRIKDADVLDSAYNDARGVTAEFSIAGTKRFTQRTA